MKACEFFFVVRAAVVAFFLHVDSLMAEMEAEAEYTWSSTS